METVKRVIANITYDGKNITEDISKFLLSVNYTDNVAGKSDELEITVEDTDELWESGWYPTKKSKLTLEFGYVGELVQAGTFEIDEIQFNGPPNTVRIKALATGISKAVRTKNSSAHESKTLKQLAQYIASKNGFTVIGTFQNIMIARVTQNRETDLSFLRRVSEEYGYVFSVRNNQLIFTTIENLEKGEAVTSITRQDLTHYDLTDKSEGTYSAATVQSHSPLVNKIVSFQQKAGQDVQPQVKADTLVSKIRAENGQQAEIKAKAALHKANSRQISGSLEMFGKPFMVAGNNFQLSGFGKNIAGKYHIETSRHNISKSGYTTSLEVRKL